MSVKYSKTRIQGFVKDYLHRHVYMKVKVYFVKLSESENYKSDVIESKLESYQNENDRSGSTRRFRCWTSNLQSILIFKIENSQGQSAGVWRAGRLTLVENRRLQKQSQLYKNQQVKNQT